jgi:hypothetical protein
MNPCDVVMEKGGSKDNRKSMDDPPPERITVDRHPPAL